MAGRRPVSYDDFDAGLSFEAVREALSGEQRQARAAGLYMFVSRSTVLGRMREYKKRAYRHYLQEWERREADPYAGLGVPLEEGDIF